MLFLKTTMRNISNPSPDRLDNSPKEANQTEAFSPGSRSM